MAVRYPTRLADMLRGVRLARELGRHDTWTAEDLRDHQRRTLDALHRDVSAGSELWRERLADGPPVLDKATMMERFDELVTDPRLRLRRLEQHLAALGGDDELLDRDFRVMATSGATGRRGVFVNTRAEWRVRIASAVRAQTLVGLGALPRRRVALVSTTNPMHISARFAKSTDVGLHHVLSLSAATPLDELARALERHRPDQLSGYPSVAALLAEEQRAGRLRIAPHTINLVAEMVTEGMESAIRAAWPAARLQNLYATTEGGIVAASCDQDRGLHMFEDLAIFENVDEQGRPVPDGELGAAVVFTDLVSRAQPRIRMAISDSVVVSSEPCPCGRPFRRITKLAGRSDDVLVLPGTGGGTVRVHPVVLRAAMATRAEVVQYAVEQRTDALHVLVVPRAEAAHGRVQEEVAGVVTEALRQSGAEGRVQVTALSALERDGGHAGKVVSSRVRPAPAR